MAKIVCLITSFKVNWDSITQSFFSISGRKEKSSPDFPIMLNLAFSQIMVVLKASSVSIVISLSGSFLTISRKILASNAIIPFSMISPSMTVSIPSSISLAVSLISPVLVSTRIHSRIDIVVLLGTALETVCTPFKRLDFEHTIFIMCIGSFLVYVQKFWAAIR